MPIGELEDNNKNRKKEGDRAERPREKDDEIEEDNHLEEDQREGARELHGADDRERMQQSTVITEPENEIDEDSERRCNQGGHGTGIGYYLSDGAKGVLGYHRPSSHSAAIMPRMRGSTQS